MKIILKDVHLSSQKNFRVALQTFSKIILKAMQNMRWEKNQKLQLRRIYKNTDVVHSSIRQFSAQFQKKTVAFNKASSFLLHLTAMKYL